MKIIKSQHAFTMIETLVALIIISIGILGFALMQIESMKAAKTADERTRAIHFATDMLERVRANQSAINFYASPIGGPITGVKSCADFVTSNVAAGAVLVRCTDSQMAAFDLNQWRTMIDDPKLGFGQGNGKAGVTVSGNNPWAVGITIQWTDREDTKNYVLTSVITK